MGEKKELKVRLSTVVFLFIILVLVVALGVVYYLGFVEQKSGDINSNDKIVSNATNSKNIYVECEKQLKGVVYRRDLGESAGYFIKDGVLYSGEKDLPNTHANTTGINSTVKYVVPLNKQTGETVVLTEDGKLYKNKKGVGNFGNSFEVILNNYSFLEILQIPNQEELMFLTKEGKVLTKDGELYLDLLKDSNANNIIANGETTEQDKNVEENIANITAKCKDAFEEYCDLKSELYSGGSLYVLKKLNLVSTIPAPEQYETTTHGYNDFYKTDIKYSDFKNAMLKYMTSDVLEKEFEENYAINVNGYLQITAMGGTATYIDIDKIELFSNDKEIYTYNISAKRSSDDNSSKDTIKLKVSFEKQNGNYVVSNVEEYTEITKTLDNEYSIEKNIMWTPNTTSYDFNTKKWLPNNSAEYYVATDKDKKLCIVDREKNLVKKFDIVITDLITSAYVAEWENTLTIIQKDAKAYDINITDFTYRQYQYSSGY